MFRPWACFRRSLGIQVRMSMRSLLDGLQKADMDFSNVVSSTIYLRDVTDQDPVVSLYGDIFQGYFSGAHDAAAEFRYEVGRCRADFFYCRETAASLRRVCAVRFYQNQGMVSSNVFPDGAARFAVAV